MHQKYQALKDNNTWTLVDLPTGKRALGYKLVFQVKYNAKGEVERYKTRLVAKGYTQHEGLHYQKTFSPIVKTVTMRAVLAMEAMHGC